ncbi:TPA: hypothetical protein F6V94_23225 [Serratia marcescens]|nr:hypothetical protein [Serratia marcescens]
MREGIDDKAFPEQGAKVSIHSDGSFEGLGCVLANTNLNVLTAVFYWFTLKRDEPFFFALFQPLPPSTNPLPICRFIPSKFLNRGMSFLRFLILPAGLDCKKTLRRVEYDLCT